MGKKEQRNHTYAHLSARYRRSATLQHVPALAAALCSPALHHQTSRTRLLSRKSNWLQRCPYPGWRIYHRLAEDHTLQCPRNGRFLPHTICELGNGTVQTPEKVDGLDFLREWKRLSPFEYEHLVEHQEKLAAQAAQEQGQAELAQEAVTQDEIVSQAK